MPNNILLAEDDDDDSMLFKEALNEISSETIFKRVKDGVELLQLLNEEENKIPDFLFLDINMPRKNGYECLTELKNTEKFKNLPIIILSTSTGNEIVNKMYNAGASLYVCKPNQFFQLKRIIQFVISNNWTNNVSPLPFEKFILD